MESIQPMLDVIVDDEATMAPTAATMLVPKPTQPKKAGSLQPSELQGSKERTALAQNIRANEVTKFIHVMDKQGIEATRDEIKRLRQENEEVFKPSPRPTLREYVDF
eukprot:gene27211-12854_t